jgi:acyl carrier protein
MNTTLDKVNEIVVVRAPELADEVGSPEWVSQNLEIDSLTLVDIVTDVETSFGVTFSDGDLEKLQSVQDILNVIQNSQ